MIKHRWKEITGLTFILVAILWLIASCYTTTVAANIATIAGAFIALYGLGGIYLQLRDNAIQTKRLRTYELAGKYYHPDYVRFSIKLRKFMEDDSVSEEDKIDVYLNNKNPKHYEIREAGGVLLNYFEEVGLMYKKDLIDREITQKLLSNVIVLFYENLQFLIKEIRAEDSAIWEN